MGNNFDFINIKSNDQLSTMNKKEQQEFIKKLLEYKLKLRGNLGIDSGITFGLELEFENIKGNIQDFTDLFNKLSMHEGNLIDRFHDTHLWTLVEDKTLTETNGKEVRSPILTDNNIFWQDLVKMCSFIKKYASVGSHSAGHIHVGSQALGDNKETILKLLKIWSTYENILYRYGYNEFLSKNPDIKYSKPAKEDYDLLYKKAINNSEYDIQKILVELAGRTKAINFSIMTLVSDYKRIAYKDTIEFRSPNATLDPVIWQNNVNTFIKLILACKKDIDLDIVNRRSLKTLNLNSDCDYNKILIDEAIEFADLIFDNNLDKLYFLRQYIKNNDISYKPMTRTKKFTI